jgi:hypothetical protein
MNRNGPISATFAIALFACVLLPRDGSAQAEGATSWTWAAALSAAVVVNDANWSVSHPIYSGGGVTWETFRGTVSQRTHFQGSVELRRGFFAIRGSVGMLPQTFTHDAPAVENDLNLLLAGLAVVLYPAAGSARRLEPYVAVGAGAQKATGDMDNGGFYLSGATGLRIGVGSHFAVDAGVQVYRLNYTQIELTSTIAKDVRTYPVMAVVGFFLNGG